MDIEGLHYADALGDGQSNGFAAVYIEACSPRATMEKDACGILAPVRFYQRLAELQNVITSAPFPSPQVLRHKSVSSSITPRLRFAVVILAAIFLSAFGRSVLAATPPGISVLESVDLAPGPDAYVPIQVAANHSTHKLYVLSGQAGPDAFPTPPDATYAIKVIDTMTNTVIGGIDLGLIHLTGYNLPFTPFALMVDESATPGGNKIYVLGFGRDAIVLRVIDGSTDTNETDEDTDIVLPETGGSSNGVSQVVANPVNHKVYYATVDGNIVVVDGPNHQVLETLTGSIGLYDHTMVVNPDTNKVFAFGLTAEKVIDSGDDTYTTISTGYFAKAAAYDPVTGRILMTATKNTETDSSLYAFDGSTGALIQSQSSVPPYVQTLTVDGAGIIYLGQPTSSAKGTAGEVAGFTTDTLTASESNFIPIGAGSLAFDGSGASARVYLLNFDFAGSSTRPELRNQVGAVNPVGNSVQKITVGYSPGKIAVNPLTKRIYVADEKAPELTVLDGTTREVIDRIATAPAGSEAFFGTTVPARDLAVSISKNHIFLSRSSTDSMTGVSTMYMDVFDGVDDSLLSSVIVNIDPSSTHVTQIAIDDTRGRLYATGLSTAGSPSYFVKVYDINATFLTTIPLPVSAVDMAVNPVTGLVYVSGNLTAMILDPVSATVTQVQTGLPGPVAINLETNRIFIAQTDGDNEVAVIDGATGEKETTIANTNSNEGDAVTDVAVDDVTNTLFVGDNSDQQEAMGRITIFDGDNGYAFLGQIDVGRYPEHIAFSTATRQLLVANNQDGTLSVLQSETPAPADRLANISTRLGVETGDNVLIGGFIITGPAGSTKQVVIRGIGPSLTAQGVSGALADPIIELHSGASTIATNDNWKIDESGQSQQAAIEATTIPPSNDSESAILITLEPGNYTAVMRGTSGGTGVGLVEVYDLAESVTTKMVNISTRGRVDIGDNVMIGGVIVTGANPSRVLLRAIGPSLTDAGVAGALQDPVLELHDGQGALITTNDNWRDDDESEIIATSIPPTDDRESALIATLYPANYTAIVRGKDDGVGVGLVEAYYLP